MNARSLALCLALLACPAAGLAQFSAFLWLPGAPGETQDTNHVGWMDLSSAGVANLFNSNPSAIEATFQRGLAFAKNVDSASAVLSLQCGRGTPFASGILDITASTNTAVPILRLQLTNVFVNLVSHNFSSGGATITEQISLQSQIQTWSYNQIDFTTGLPINDVSSSWDFVSQAPTVTGPTWSAIHASTIDLFADCTAQGGSTVTKMGFSYSPTAVNPTPTLGGTGVSEWDFGNPGVTGMSGVINSLTPSTEYSVVSFAVNSYGVGYSTVTNFTTGPGPSGSLVVTTLQDVSGVAGVNSLRDAVNYAYELNDTATVTFAPSLFTNGPGTLVLSGSANPVSIENLGGILTIHGPSSGLLTISGNNQTEIFYLSAASVVLDGMTVANSSGSASAIRAGGSALLTVSNMVFVENYSSENGGAVNSQGSLGLWVYDCTFATNTTAGEGGAIFAGSGVYTVNVVDSAFAGNVSGLNEDGTTNRNAGAGGAIYTATAYGLYLVNSTFVGNQVENGPGGAAPPLLAAIIDLGLMAVFAIQHSVMARQGFKRWWTKIVPEPVERSTYVVASSAALALLLWQWRPIPVVVWWVENRTFAMLILALALIGWLIVGLSTFLISHFELFGLAQVGRHLTRRAPQPSKLRTPLFYRFVRHPLYLGFAIAFWATPV